MASLADTLGRSHEPLTGPECSKLALQIGAVFAFIVGDRALLTQREADALAEPAARMLSRHTTAQKIIRKFTDPLALTAVAGAIVKNRIVGVRSPAQLASVPQQSRPPMPQQAVAAPMQADPEPLPDPLARAILADALAQMASIP